MHDLLSKFFGENAGSRPVDPHVLDDSDFVSLFGQLSESDMAYLRSGRFSIGETPDKTVLTVPHLGRNPFQVSKEMGAEINPAESYSSFTVFPSEIFAIKLLQHMALVWFLNDGDLAGANTLPMTRSSFLNSPIIDFGDPYPRKIQASQLRVKSGYYARNETTASGAVTKGELYRVAKCLELPFARQATLVVDFSRMNRLQQKEFFDSLESLISDVGDVQRNLQTYLSVGTAVPSAKIIEKLATLRTTIESFQLVEVRSALLVGVFKHLQDLIPAHLLPKQEELTSSATRKNVLAANVPTATTGLSLRSIQNMLAKLNNFGKR